MLAAGGQPYAGGGGGGGGGLADAEELRRKNVELREQLYTLQVAPLPRRAAAASRLAPPPW